MYGYAAQVPRQPPGRKTGRKPVRLLIAVWGRRYIDVFCRVCLPTLLSPNNLPGLARAHDLEVVFLTRSRDARLFAAYPAFDRLVAVAPVAFVEIDDILSGVFDPAADNYGMALTHAFFRGISSYGEAALDLDFVLWNGDFAAADGTLSAIADLIAAGVRCTLAVSLRVDGDIEDALALHAQAGGVAIAVAPRDMLAAALRHLHPTVNAKMVNTFDHQSISHPNQFYWRVADDLLVCRSFIWFPLQVHPEVLPEAIYGFCDYVFMPELVPSGDCHYETLSDRVLIVEIQHDAKAWEEVLAADGPITAEEVAPGLGYWTTGEHIDASRQLVVFDAGAAEARDLSAARRTTDDFMDAVYALLPDEPQWHNGHVYWRECHARAGLPYQPPGADHPRSRLAAALRWTGYDLDIVRDGWPNADPPLAAMLREPPRPDPPTVRGVEAWLDRLYSLCHETWLADPAAAILDDDVVDLTAPGFRGFGWGTLRRHGDGWARQLGPDRRAILLLRVPPRLRLRLRFHGVRSTAADLQIAVNGLAVESEIVSDAAELAFTSVCVVDAAAAASRGRLFVMLQSGEGGFAVSAVEVERTD